MKQLIITATQRSEENEPHEQNRSIIKFPISQRMIQTFLNNQQE